MARPFPPPPTIDRDGTSQADRALPALDPDYVAVDERSPHDLLTFAREYAKELVYYDSQDQKRDDWHGFLEQNLAELAALVEDAEGEAGGRVDKPHLALFIAFLRLLRHPRDVINSFTRRHLELYYEQLLRMTRKQAVPDRVHVLMRLAAGSVPTLVPAGALLRAGKDVLGRERVYRTDDPLVVGRAAVARLSSVYTQLEVVGLREARERHKGTKDEAFIKMLEIALGDPRPGDPLPKYPGPAGKDVTPPLLLELKQRLDFAEKHLHMDFSDLRSLMVLHGRRTAAQAEWATINQLLTKAGRTRLDNQAWQLDPADPRDFYTNLSKALGGPLDFVHDELTEVDSLEDLDAQRHRQDVQKFVRDKLYMSMEDFGQLMQLKIRIDGEWREISRILEQAGRRKRKTPSFRLDPALPQTDFAGRLQDALGPLPFAELGHALLPAVTDIKTYHDAIVAIEGYFHLNAAQAHYVLSALPGASPEQWNDVYRLLIEAHREKVYADRRQVLRSALEAAPNRLAGFKTMLAVALGRDRKPPKEPEPSELLADLKEFLPAKDDHEFLATVPGRVGGLSPDELTRIYQTVELAQRVREKLPPPEPRRATWLDLHAAEDATGVLADAEAKPRRWKTFGQRPPEAAPQRPPPPRIGWAIASPTLLLAQGARSIVLTLGFRATGFDKARLDKLFAPNDGDAGPLRVEISTEKGWIPLTVAGVTGDYATLSKVQRAIAEPLSAIQLTLTLADNAPATAPPGRETGIVTPWPTLRLMLLPRWSAERRQHVTHYEPLRDLLLAAVHVSTSVDGLVPAALQNDDGLLNPKKPFDPFGAVPAVGSRFYIGDPELVLKQLTTLTFRVDWKGVPKEIAKHYANYPGYPAGGLTAEICLVDERTDRPLGTPPALYKLFESETDAAQQRVITIEDIAAKVDKPPAGYRYRPVAELPTDPQVSAWPRHLRWELKPNDFQHPAYPTVATQKSIALSAALIKATDPKTVPVADYQVNPPYTPKVKTLTIDYTAATEVVLTEADARRAEQLFHVHPFGAGPIEAEPDPRGPRFLPRYDHEGELYIGLRHAQPPETVTLLFQLTEGSADPDLAPVPVEWSYLSGDRWLSLHDGHLLSDTTGGLIDTGIVTIALPPAEPSTRLPGDLYWLRVAIPYHADSVCDAVAIHAQAVSATFVDRDNAAEHFARKLPERSITGLVQRIPRIAAVEQPYPSRGGRPAEARENFYTRVSERLRHKKRALTAWDYERLVLERFPELYKVKCIPADARDPDGLGAVTLVVIPGIRGQSTANPFEPKVPAATIAAITAYLADKSPHQAAIRVRNAHFVQIKVRVGVRFRGSGDEGFYKRQLNEELNRYLSPWAFDEGADIDIGGKIFANSIVNFIDGREYVDYVDTIKLFSSDDDGRTFKPAPEQPGAPYHVASSRPYDVLVAARQHEIDVISAFEYTTQKFTGINHMRIELDFIVAGSK